jgi:hypothetical protein
MKKVHLRISIEVVPAPPEIEIPEERPGQGASESMRVMAHAVPAILRGISPGFGMGNPTMLTVSRSVELQLSGDLKKLAEIAGKFDQLATQIEADNLEHPG